MKIKNLDLNDFATTFMKGKLRKDIMIKWQIRYSKVEQKERMKKHLTRLESIEIIWKLVFIKRLVNYVHNEYQLPAYTITYGISVSISTALS